MAQQKKVQLAIQLQLPRQETLIQQEEMVAALLARQLWFQGTRIRATWQQLPRLWPLSAER